MKPEDKTWREFLDHGIRLMEGTETDPQLANRRWLEWASWVFEKCCNQTEDRAVQGEAYLYLAYCAHERRQPKEAETWLAMAQSLIHYPLLPPETQARCSLLLGILHEHGYGYYTKILDVLSRADDTPSNRKLRGDVESAIGSISWEHGSAQDGEAPHAGGAARAIEYFEQAIATFSAIEEPDMHVLHALAAASGRAGVALQAAKGYKSARAAEHFRRAEDLLATRVREPCLRSAYWRRRAGMALLFCRPQGFWFLLRSLPPGIACWWQKRRRQEEGY